MSCLYFKVTKAAKKSPVLCLDVIWSPTVLVLGIYFWYFEKSILKNVKYLSKACKQYISLVTEIVIPKNTVTELQLRINGG